MLLCVGSETIYATVFFSRNPALRGLITLAFSSGGSHLLKSKSKLKMIAC